METPIQTRVLRWTVASLLLVIGLFFALPTPGQAENERVITFYYDGQERTIVTDAPTVEEAIKRSDVRVDSLDAVEPARDTKLIAASYNINIYRARPVTVVDGPNRFEVVSPHTSARQIVADAGLQLANEDGYHLTRINDFVGEGSVGLKLTIERSVPVNFILYGKEVKARTLAKTIGGFLKEKNLEVKDDIRLWPTIDTPITPNMSFALYTDGTMEIKEEEVLFTVKKIQDADRPMGFKEVKAQGQPGKRFVMYHIINGQRREVQSYVLVPPQEQVEVVGTKSAGFSGDLAAALAALRSCEARSNGYKTNTGNGYYGAYQFGLSTWRGHAPDGWKDALPSEAPGDVQDAAAVHLYQARGWQPWPGCTKKLGLQDIYR